jgi:hypothetical protein
MCSAFKLGFERSQLQVGNRCKVLDASRGNDGCSDRYAVNLRVLAPTAELKL